MSVIGPRVERRNPMEFLIPMRGNEGTCLHALVLENKIPNPHEG